MRLQTAAASAVGKKRPLPPPSVDAAQGGAEHEGLAENDPVDSKGMMELEPTDTAVGAVPETSETRAGVSDGPKKKRVRLSDKRAIWSAQDMDLKSALFKESVFVLRKLIAALTHPPGPLLCALGLHIELFTLLKLSDSDSRRRLYP